jgi:hypothetical protein
MRIFLLLEQDLMSVFEAQFFPVVWWVALPLSI